MAVYKRGYRRYEGPVTGRLTRFLVLPRFDWLRLFRQRMVPLLMLVSLVWPFLCAVFIYLSNHADLLKGMNTEIRNLIEIKGSFFIVFMRVQAVFSLFLAAIAGPGLIAPDLTNNALPLYFSRPFSRAEYVLARLTTLSVILSLVTWVPGLFLVGMQTGMAGGTWLRENWRIGVGIVAGFAVWILLVGLVSLAASAYAKMRVVAGGIVLGFFLILGGATVIANQVFRSTWGHLFNPTWTVRRLWYAMFNLEPPQGPGTIACVLILAALFTLLVIVLERRLRPVEVVS